MEIEVIRAWPHRHEARQLRLPAGTTVAQALAACGWADDPEISGYAVFGVAVDADRVLQAGDRLELLRPLQLDPKEARRRRASKPR
ncbi:RnfH family protein [Pseudoxanthomonas dokdonensis]|uniref:UPF0125 protein ABB29_05040 n=1 Tax=Pseudoxanthomonas dokdonensis TaxID=344882 RepID=A0A0R0CYK9_9GAMM|nr:RnfH family protein [Pseudoxanthomonas dokdonensis]KRG71223.1 protein rnfH [Pseudoxanthomonas dokdonensis]